MEPNEALGIAAQVAVMLAGCAGIVVVLPESVHQWSRVDRFRLRLLLSNSIFPLAYSLFGMLLQTIKPAPDLIRQWCSAFAVVFQVPFAIANFRTPRHLAQDEFKGVPKMLFYPLFCDRNRHAFASILQHRSVEQVLAVLRRDLRPSHGCDVAVRAACSSCAARDQMTSNQTMKPTANRPYAQVSLLMTTTRYSRGGLSCSR